MRNFWLGFGAITALAGLDLVGAYLAKEYSLHQRWVLLVIGVVTFGVLFFVYVVSLSLTELWIVTFGWVVLLEIGVLVLDRMHYNTAVRPQKLALAVLIVVLQLLLMKPDKTVPASTNVPASEPRATSPLDAGPSGVVSSASDVRP